MSHLVLLSKLPILTGTLNRTLKQLKDKGLIEYSGSKKTGGYQVADISQEK